MGPAQAVGCADQSEHWAVAFLYTCSAHQVDLMGEHARDCADDGQAVSGAAGERLRGVKVAFSSNTQEYSRGPDA